MRILSLAICSLGIWVLLSAFIDASWPGIIFGAIAAVLALIGALSNAGK